MDGTGMSAIGDGDTQQLITAEDLAKILRGRPGLIVGPTFSMGAGCLSELAKGIARANDCDEYESEFFIQIDKLLENGMDATELREQLRQIIHKLPKNKSNKSIAKTRWSAVLSASWDSVFEQELQNWCDNSPTRPPVTVISDFQKPVPPRTIPVYKLMGSLYRDDFAVCSIDYRLRTPKWHRALRDFATAAKGQPVLCIGMEDCPWALLDLLAIMLSDSSMESGPLLLLQEDPITSNRQLIDMGKRGLRILRVAMKLDGFLACLKRSESISFTPPLPFGSSDKSYAEELDAFSEFAVVVNTRAKSGIDASEIRLLRDLLFSPTTPRWEPFILSLDFPRTITKSLVAFLSDGLNVQSGVSVAAIVRGASSTGKTTIMKRAALELSNTNALVLWFRPYFYQDGPKQLRSFAECIVRTGANNGKRVVIFVDDPISLGTISVEEIKGVFAAAKIEVVLAVSVRSTDVAVLDSAVSSYAFDGVSAFDVPEKFDDLEWKALPEYLIKIGVCETFEDANSRVSVASSRGCSDILSMLFLMLPETRKYITTSVRNEYFRLGDRTNFSQIVLGELNHSSELLKKAYELVAVAGKYDTPMPIEVLVSTLRIKYTDWLDAGNAIDAGGLKWGLLYEEDSGDADTLVYRTRNSTVTEIVINTVNGGALGYSGELAHMLRLLGACDGSSAIYREFCIRILVPYDRPQLSHLEFQEGLELYCRAIEALPFEDRTLVHHMGLWQKNKGHNPLEARKTLERALNTDLYPYSTRTESKEHIYTSLAATEIDALELKEVSPEEGKQRVFDALERARPEQFQNPYAVHVQAGLLVKLADLTSGPSDPDFINLMHTALADVDRMLLFLKSEFESRKDSRQQVEMLENISSEVLDRCASIEQLTEDAEKMWSQYHRQDGFVLVARKLYSEAKKKNKGSYFKRACDFCIESKDRIEQAGQALSSQLAEVMLHIYFHWRVRRTVFSENAEIIDWNLIDYLAGGIVHNSRSKCDPLYSYLLALAKSHLGDWIKANVIFDDLRRRQLPRIMLYRDRDYLMNDKGGMRRVQGVVRKGAGRDYLHVEILNADILLDRHDKWAQEGQTDHAYIRFRFAGPVAVREP